MLETQNDRGSKIYQKKNKSEKIHYIQVQVPFEYTESSEQISLNILYTRYWYYIEYVRCKETVVMMYSFYMYKQNMKNGQQQYCCSKMIMIALPYILNFIALQPCLCFQDELEISSEKVHIGSIQNPKACLSL